MHCITACIIRDAAPHADATYMLGCTACCASQRTRCLLLGIEDRIPLTGVNAAGGVGGQALRQAWQVWAETAGARSAGYRWPATGHAAPCCGGDSVRTLAFRTALMQPKTNGPDHHSRLTAHSHFATRETVVMRFALRSALSTCKLPSRV